LHTPIIGESRATSALHRQRGTDQVELNALNKYVEKWQSR
jgi:hypothetical protein